jgi:hypothetical protein
MCGGGVVGGGGVQGSNKRVRHKRGALHHYAPRAWRQLQPQSQRACWRCQRASCLQRLRPRRCCQCCCRCWPAGRWRPRGPRGGGQGQRRRPQRAPGWPPECSSARQRRRRQRLQSGAQQRLLPLLQTPRPQWLLQGLPRPQWLLQGLPLQRWRRGWCEGGAGTRRRRLAASPGQPPLALACPDPASQALHACQPGRP